MGFQRGVLLEKTLFFKHSYPPQKLYVQTFKSMTSSTLFMAA